MATPPFGPFPATLGAAIQENYLERGFIDSLRPNLVFRAVADFEMFPGRIGDSISKTRVGLMQPNTVPLDPSSNTNIDNGLTPVNYSVEQYSLSIAQYPQVAPNINLMDDEVTIASFAMRNAVNLGIATESAVDTLARVSLFNRYMGGNTVVTATLGAPGVTIQVDDVRGFQEVVVNGQVVPVSPTNPLAVSINGTVYSITAFTVDVVNVSSAISVGGISGTITASANISVVDGTAGNLVLASNAPLIIRPNGRASTDNLISTDFFNMSSILAGVAYLRNNAVPTIDGKYNLYLDATSMQELYADPEFQILNRGVSVRDPSYQNAFVYEFLDCRIISTTQMVIQSPQTTAPVPVLTSVHRPIMCGAGCLVEAVFQKGLEAIRNMSSGNSLADMSNVNMFNNPFNINVVRNVKDMSMAGMYMYVRHPLDRLGQIISQTANYTGGFVVPTDVTTTSNVILTAGNAAYKRAVIFEHA